MKFLCTYLYKKAYTAPVLVCLVSTSWLLPSLLFSLKKYNMTQLQGLLVCLDQPLRSLSIYYLYYNPFLFILCLTLASFSFIMLLLWYDECCCLCVFAFSLIRKGEMLPQHWKFHSKKCCYILMTLHSKGLPTFMSFLPNLKIGISSKLLSQLLASLWMNVQKRSKVFWPTFAVSFILEQRAALMSSVRSTLMGGELFKILFVFFTYLKVDVRFPFCLWDITWRDN